MRYDTGRPRAVIRLRISQPRTTSLPSWRQPSRAARQPGGGRTPVAIPATGATSPSRIRCQAATGSWTKARQWETERTLFSSARATMCPLAKVNGVWPFNDAWLRTSLSEARR